MCARSAGRRPGEGERGCGGTCVKTESVRVLALASDRSTGAIAGHDAQLQQLASNPFGAPHPVVARHACDQVPYRGTEMRTSATGAGLPTPEQSPTLTLPAHDRFRCNEGQIFSPIDAESASEDPQQLVREAKPTCGAAVIAVSRSRTRRIAHWLGKCCWSRPSLWPPGRPIHRRRSRPSLHSDVRCVPAHIHQVGAGSGLEGVQPLVSAHVHLPALLVGPESSGSSDSFRRCQGCSHPRLRPQDQAALSFSRPLRRPAGGVLSSPHGQTAPRGAPSVSNTLRAWHASHQTGRPSDPWARLLSKVELVQGE